MLLGSLILFVQERPRLALALAYCAAITRLLVLLFGSSKPDSPLRSVGYIVALVAAQVRYVQVQGKPKNVGRD